MNRAGKFHSFTFNAKTQIALLVDSSQLYNIYSPDINTVAHPLNDKMPPRSCFGIPMLHACFVSILIYATIQFCIFFVMITSDDKKEDVKANRNGNLRFRYSALVAPSSASQDIYTDYTLWSKDETYFEQRDVGQQNS